jgi:hypothetical protein
MLALQSILEQLMRPELIWVLIPLAGIGIGALAIIFEPIKDSIRKTERAEARKMYERLAMEKLDVIKTAVAMGYGRDDLADLDSRLEQAIGADQMKMLRDGKTPKVPLPEVDLAADSLDGAQPGRGARNQEQQ